MSAIDVQNQKDIRDPMIISVKVGNPNNPIFNLNNANIISCELNLRSDLKPIDPALPESEIVVKAYWPNPISDNVLLTPVDTKIYYQSGYENDMSPVRTFYLAEQIKWANSVLEIRGVDAVHFLDYEAQPIATDFSGYTIHSSGGLSRFQWGFEGRSGTSQTTTAISPAINLYRNMKYMLNNSGVTYTAENNPGIYSSAVIPYTEATTIIEGNAREAIANITNLMRIDSPVSGIPNLYFTYVDAGIPKLTCEKPISKWTIRELDCGDIKNETKRGIVRIEAANKTITPVDYTRARKDDSCKVGSINMVYGVGGNFSFNDYTVCADAKETDSLGQETILHVTGPYNYSGRSGGTVQTRPVEATITEGSNTVRCGVKIFKEGGFMSWGSSGSMQYIFMDTVKDDAGESRADLYNACVRLGDDPKVYTKTGYGDTETPSKTKWIGKTSEKRGDTVYELLPQRGFEQLMNRSTKTGSFTWKGDPRMQPRDVFTFVYKDGTEELRTIETISLKHENGGTVAQITYRKGIV